MPPRKRKATAVSELPSVNDAVQAVHVDPKALEAIQQRLKLIDAAVEERCAAITAAADEAVAKLLQELKSQLIGLPKKIRAMPYKEYLQTVEQPAPPAAAADAAAAFVDNKLAQMQQRSEAAATAAPTTRSLRSRARSATAAPEPKTVRTTRTRAPVPKFNAGASSSQAVEPAPAAAEDPAAAEAAPAPEAAAAAPEQPSAAAVPEATQAADAAACTPPAANEGRSSRAGRGRTVTLLEPPAEEDEDSEGGRQGAAAAGPGADAEARRAAAEMRAKEKVDARLAAIGLAASTAVRGGGRTAMRAAQPGEACFSKNGSPLSIHPNITRARGRTGAARGWALMTPALAAAAGEAAGPGGAMLGCFTLVKKGGAATGAAAATGRAGRSRAATGAGRGAGAAAAQGAAAAEAAAEDTAMVITTEDGASFAVDAAGGLEAVPASHRPEVEAKLRAIQQFAATALRAA